jgi:hypothetical protein
MNFVTIRVNNTMIALSKNSIQLVLRGFSIDNTIILGSFTMPLTAPVCTENDKVFKHQSLLESTANNPIIENAELIINDTVIAKGFLLLLKATKFKYEFSFIYQPISNIFFNQSIKEIAFQDALFWQNKSAPVSYVETMGRYNDVVTDVVRYDKTEKHTYALYPVKCPSWDKPPDGFFSAGSYFEFSSYDRRLNLFNGALNQLVSNYLEVDQTHDGFQSNHGLSYDYNAQSFSLQKIIPFLFTAFVLETLWTSQSWKVKGDLFEDDNFLRDTIVNSYSNDWYDHCGPIRFNLKPATPLVVGSKLPLFCYYQYDNWWNNLNQQVIFPSSILVYTGNDFPAVQTRVYIEFYFDMIVTGYTLSVEIHEDGSPTNYFGTGTGSGNKLVVDFVSTDGVTQACNVDYYAYSLKLKATTIPAPQLASLSSINGVWFLCTTDGAYDYINVHNPNVSYKNHLPDITKGEFIKTILTRFGATQRYDFLTKTVYYDKLHTSISKNQQSLLNDKIILDSYEKELQQFLTETKYSNTHKYAYDTSVFTIGQDNPYTERFLLDINACVLKSEMQGTYSNPVFETTGAGSQLGREHSEGLIFLHYKGKKVGSDGLYPAPYASASNKISNGTIFNQYDMALSYIIPHYWAAYIAARSNGIRFQAIMNVALLKTLNMFLPQFINYQIYFLEEIIIQIEENNIATCEIKCFKI